MNDKLSHAYIVSSPSERAREEKVMELVCAMLCSGQAPRPCGACRDCRKARAGIHPDVTVIERLVEKGKLRQEILVQQVRYMVSDAIVLPNEAARKVYIVRDADTMNKTAQNAFLKLLEEPPEYVCFILCAEHPGAFLDTVRSRCTELSINAPEAVPDEAMTEKAEVYLKLAAKGDAAELFRFCTGCETMDREAAMEFIAALRTALGDMLCMRRAFAGLDGKAVMGLVEQMDKADKYLSQNVNPKQVFGMLGVYLPDKTK